MDDTNSAFTLIFIFISYIVTFLYMNELYDREYVKYTKFRDMSLSLSLGLEVGRGTEGNEI